MAAVLSTRVPAPHGAWARVLAWATRPDNARTDFTILGSFHGLVGMFLLLVPAITRTPSFRILMTLAPERFWALTFLATFAFSLLGLRVRNDRWAGRFRHYAWMAAGTNLAMWLAGSMLAGGGPVPILILLLLLSWHTLTAARLELPRALDTRHRLG